MSFQNSPAIRQNYQTPPTNNTQTELLTRRSQSLCTPANKCPSYGCVSWYSTTLTRRESHEVLPCQTFWGGSYPASSACRPRRRRWIFRVFDRGPWWPLSPRTAPSPPPPSPDWIHHLCSYFCLTFSEAPRNGLPYPQSLESVSVYEGKVSCIL